MQIKRTAKQTFIQKSETMVKLKKATAFYHSVDVFRMHI